MGYSGGPEVITSVLHKGKERQKSEGAVTTEECSGEAVLTSEMKEGNRMQLAAGLRKRQGNVISL